MISQGIQAFSGKRILLLQGPVGPFFARLAKDLRGVGAQVFKVNFNAGDCLFYPRRALCYRGTMEGWPGWLEALLRRLKIDELLLFGDCRPIHSAAHGVATRLGLKVGVFEEGYIRPDYVTLERFGVNGYSQFSRDPEVFRKEVPTLRPRQAVGKAYWSMVWFGFCYFLAGALGTIFFPRYVHHRPLSLLEALPWARSIWRKEWYRWRERGIEKRLTTSLSKRYFLVPLQVFNDAQIVVHADVDGVEDFISRTLDSFAKSAPPDTFLVFKHHPMDRGYRDYSRLILSLAGKAGLKNRVMYIHDQHLPSLLDHARGVVVINSTVGISALHHGAPTVVCGFALYDIPGLTYQGGLDDFWAAGSGAKPDRSLYESFRGHLIAKTQLNGSFYRPLKHADAVYSGLVWRAEPKGYVHAPVCSGSPIFFAGLAVRHGAPNPRQSFLQSRWRTAEVEPHEARQAEIRAIRQADPGRFEKSRGIGDPALGK